VEERTLCLHGDEGAWIMGRWFCERSTCNMTRINLYADEAQAGEDDEILSGRVVAVVEGSWELSESAVQCVDGIPIALLDRSTVTLDSCVIGGSGGNDARLARVGITVGEDSKVSAICTLALGAPDGVHNTLGLASFSVGYLAILCR